MRSALPEKISFLINLEDILIRDLSDICEIPSSPLPSQHNVIAEWSPIIFTNPADTSGQGPWISSYNSVTTLQYHVILMYSGFTDNSDNLLPFFSIEVRKTGPFRKIIRTKWVDSCQVLGIMFEHSKCTYVFVRQKAFKIVTGTY